MREFLLKAVCGAIVCCFLWVDAMAQSSVDAAAPISTARLALAEQVVDAAGVKANTARAMDTIAQSMLKNMQDTSNPEMSAYAKQVMRQEITLMESQFDPLYAEMYARTFTDDQLTDLLSFYSSPTGRMLVAKTPELARQSHLAAAPLIPVMQRDLVDKIFTHVCAVQKCTDKQRAALDAAKAKLMGSVNQSAAPSSQ